MPDDFIIITRRPTPDEMLTRLCEFVPGFRTIWQDSMFIKKDGSFSVHAVFSEFSSYMHAHFAEFNDASWKGLFDYVEQCVTTDAYSDSGVANAACTCFLENIAGEGMLSRKASHYLGPESRKYFDRWDVVE
jgi:hypothetical protein